jgi:SnoaL-like domain
VHADNNALSDLDRLLIEREIGRMAVQYTHWVDFGHAERIIDLFVADGIWHDGQQAYEGHAAIRAWFRKRQEMTQRTSRHVLSNHLIDIRDRDHASGTVYFVLYRHDGDPAQAVRPLDRQPAIVGEYRDEYVRTPQGWRIRTRRAMTTFAQTHP